MSKDDLKAAINQAIRKHPLCPHVKRLSLFGSRLRGEERPDSDVDLLLEYQGNLSLFDLIRMQQDLEKILGKSVDLVTEPGLSKYIRKQVLASAEIVYEG